MIKLHSVIQPKASEEWKRVTVLLSVRPPKICPFGFNRGCTGEDICITLDKLKGKTRGNRSGCGKGLVTAETLIVPPAEGNKGCLYRGGKFTSYEDVASILNEVCRVLTCMKCTALCFSTLKIDFSVKWGVSRPLLMMSLCQIAKDDTN